MKHAMTTLSAALLISACAHAEELSRCITTPTAIPDGSTSGVTIPLTFEAPQRVVTGVRVELDIEHEWVGDLVVAIEAPTGEVVIVMLRPGFVPSGFPGPWGCGGDDIDATFTDNATMTVTDACSTTTVPVYTGELLPEESFSVFDGVNPDGVWNFFIADAQAGDSGTLNSACVILEVEEDCDNDGAPNPCTCPGDFDNDGDVDLGDFGVFGGAFGSMVGDANYNALADFDDDGDVDLGDFGVFGGVFGTVFPAGDCPG